MYSVENILGILIFSWAGIIQYSFVILGNLSESQLFISHEIMRVNN